jgi:hypothetical protein
MTQLQEDVGEREHRQQQPTNFERVDGGRLEPKDVIGSGPVGAAAAEAFRGRTSPIVDLRGRPQRQHDQVSVLENFFLRQ